LADEAFSQQYARAKQRQADRFAEELLEIADEGRNDWIERELPGGSTLRVADHEHIQRSRLRVDTRKWLMSKMLPKKYGDSVALTGAEGGPLVVRWLRPDEAESE
jgi:Bacteriophage Sf6, terminase small subunit-like